MSVTREQFALVLDRLATATRTELEPDLIGVWYPSFGRFDAEALARAAELLPERVNWFPSMREMLDATKEATQAIARQRALNGGGPNENCDYCHGSSWGKGPQINANGMGYESAAPCRTCNPLLFEAVDALNAERRRFRVRSGDERTYEANPVQGIATVRDALHADGGEF